MRFGIVFFFLILLSNILAQNYTQKIYPKDSRQGAFFGNFVNINKDFVFVSAYKDSEKNSANGAIYIFKNNNGKLSEISKISPDDGIAEQYFGYSINSFGDWFIAGAHHDSDFGASSGAAYILHKDNANLWTITQKLTPNELSEADEFGKKVDIYGDYAISCAYLDDDKSTNSGVVYVYKIKDSVWEKIDKLYPSDPNSFSQFGLSIDIFKNQIIVGAPYNNECDNSCGAAYIFELINDKWAETCKLVPDDIDQNDQFGLVVKIKDNYAFISSAKDDDNGIDCGAVYIYKKEKKHWNFYQKITPFDGEDYDGFGYDIDIGETIAVVGSYFDDDNGENSGSVYIYEKKLDSWVFKRKLTPSDGEESDAFGSSIFLDKNKLIVGAYSDSDKGFLSGSAYIFNLDQVLNTQFTKTNEDIYKVYPAYFKDYIFIESKHPQTKIDIFNINGQIVFSQVFNETRSKINTSEFKRGIYLVRLSNGFTNKIFKIIKN